MRYRVFYHLSLDMTKRGKLGPKIYSVISDTLLYQISLYRVFICKHDYEVHDIVIQYFALHQFMNVDPPLM